MMQPSVIPAILLAAGSLSQLLPVQPSPVLVLVANGSDITINFPGENNNNRMLSIVTGSGNNNPSVFDWVNGNGANKAPSIRIGNGPETVPDVADSAEDKLRSWWGDDNDSGDLRPLMTTAPAGLITRHGYTGRSILPTDSEATRNASVTESATVA